MDRQVDVITLPPHLIPIGIMDSFKTSKDHLCRKNHLDHFHSDYVQSTMPLYLQPVPNPLKDIYGSLHKDFSDVAVNPTEVPLMNSTSTVHEGMIRIREIIFSANDILGDDSSLENDEDEEEDDDASWGDVMECSSRQENGLPSQMSFDDEDDDSLFSSDFDDSDFDDIDSDDCLSIDEEELDRSRGTNSEQQ